MNTRRSSFLAGVVTTATLAPSIVRAQPVDLRIGALTIDTTAEPFYAQNQGFFARAGIGVDITTLQSGAASAAAVIGGTTDVGIIDAVSMAAAHERGVPISYLAPAALHTPTAPAYAVIVPKESPIKTAKDLDGKTIAVNGLKNILQIPLMGWMDNNGGDSSSVKFVELPFPAMAPAVLSGKIDGASLSEPFITNALETGNFRMISVTKNGIADTFAFSGWCATNEWAAKHPDLVRKFVSVMAETARWANTHHADSAPILVAISKSPYNRNLIRVVFGERLEARLFQPVFDAAAKYGVVKKSFPAAEVFSPAARV